VLAVIAFAMTGEKWRRYAVHSAALEDCNEEFGFTLPGKVARVPGRIEMGSLKYKQAV
jgi:hypothetical protein